MKNKICLTRKMLKVFILPLIEFFQKVFCHLLNLYSDKIYLYFYIYFIHILSGKIERAFCQKEIPAY